MSLHWLHHEFSTVEKGAFGTVTSLGTTVISLLPHLETSLRIMGLCIGICVGVATLISVLHDIQKKRREK